MKTIKLGDVCGILSGFAFKSSGFGEKGMPIIRIRDVVRGFTETFYDSEFDSDYVVENGDMLVGMDGDFNLAKWNGGRALLNQRVCKLEVDENEYSKEFLYYFLPTKLLKIWNDTPFVTVKHLSVKKIIDIDIPDLPLSTQKQIAAILEKADQLRKDCQQMEQELNNLAQAVFIDMFGDPVSNPKGWEVEALSSLGEVKGGLQVTSKRSSNPIEVPYLRVANVYRDMLNLDVIKTIRVTQNEIERTRLNYGDVLFVEGHGNPDEVGRSSVWKSEISLCLHQNHLIRFRPSDRVLPDYISAYTNSSSGKRQLLGMSKTTSGLNTLSTSNISSLKCLVPPLELQKKYIEIIKSINDKRLLNRKIISDYEYTFNALMQQAFKGDLNLKNKVA